MKQTKPMYRYRLRPGDQIPTQPITIAEIMASPAFAQGVRDVRANRGYPSGYDLWTDTNECWSYERGRQWAQLVPRHVRLKIGGEITPEALRAYRRHRCDIQ